jgi:uncharacterized protein YigE (DUF2233 family)
MTRAAILALLLPGVAQAACRDMTFEAMPFTVCEVHADEDLRLFAQGPDGNLGSFSAVNGMLANDGKTLGFAMNAGMYHRDRSPVGLFMADGTEASPLITRDGPGNFGMLPNGVFCVGDTFGVIESRTFAETNPSCTYATQSGPMLVIDGALHPRFIPDSPSVYVRNGVGVSPDGQTAYFTISNVALNFHAFGRFFRDALGTPNALYFDGSISRLYAPDLGRHDAGFPMGPIIGTVVDQG